MATDVSNLANIRSAAASFKPFVYFKNTSLFSKINWVFGLYVGCLTAGASYCFYNVYKAYQLKCHTSFGLDDQFKLVKCGALLAEVQNQENNSEDAQPLLQECESLLASMTDKMCSHEKEKLLLKLSQYYAKNNPEYSYEIAKQLSSSYHLFDAAQSIQKTNPGLAQLLFTQASKAKTQEDQRRSRPQISLDLEWSLKLARAFCSLENSTLATFFLENASFQTAQMASLGARVIALCKIAQCYHGINYLEHMNYSIESAQKLLSENITGVDLIEARLVLANTFFSIGEFEKMDQELGKVLGLFQENPPLIAMKDLYSLAKLIKKIAENKNAESRFKSFAIGPLIKQALQALAPTSERSADGKRAEAYLTIASIYQEKTLNHPGVKEQAISHAFHEIRALSESTDEEIESKIDFLNQLIYFCKQDPDKARRVIQILQGLYDRCLPDNISARGWNKPSLGKRILALYNETQLIDESELFFQRYLLDLVTRQDEKAIDKINRLVTYAQPHIGSIDRPQHTKAQLEAAESLLSQLTSFIEYKYALMRIAEGYLQVDRQKSLKLLENHENHQAKSHLITASVTAIAMGVLHFYPRVGPFLSFGSAVVRLF